MKVVISHPIGNANVRATALACSHAGILSNFYTSIAVFESTLLGRLSRFSPFSELNRRRFDNELQSVTKTWPWFEMSRTLSLKFGFNKLTAHESGFFSVDAICRGFDKRVAYLLKRGAYCDLNAIYAYEDSALNTFIEAKHYGIQCIYDLPIGYWKAARTLLQAEKERWPEWTPTLTGFRDSAEKLARKDEELSLANRIFVASSFTANTLKDYPGQLPPIDIIPYGFPPVTSEHIHSTSKNKPLKLLFVGGLTQRKGIADLFAAVKNIGSSVELTIVGQKTNTSCAALDAALLKHKWIPSLPHHQILNLMRIHDVLVFPSLFEGFGLVITEAMSQGTPVITTNRTAGPDLITHGRNGWIIEAGSTVALQEAIENIIGKNEIIAEAGIAAMETAKERPWEVYGKELSDAILNKHIITAK